jgi:Na+/H+ antiporter NhaD/arsenite permease-like protein
MMRVRPWHRIPVAALALAPVLLALLLAPVGHAQGNAPAGADAVTASAPAAPSAETRPGAAGPEAEGEAEAGRGGHGPGWVPPRWSIVGFVLFLLGIAIIPLAAPHFWEPNRNKALFTAALGIPFGIYVVMNDPMALVNSLHEYVQFIILLFSLFVISGGIWLDGDIRSTPKNNVIFLTVGALLASLIGTTGACMLLIRPLLHSNRERKRVVHTVIFFIFIVANIGGSLTPLGDPPLFLGYLRGVPFLWTLRLWKLWLPTCVLLLTLYYIIDTYAWGKESEEDKKWDATAIQPLKMNGGLNFLFLFGVILAIFTNPYIARALTAQGLSERTVEWLPIREVLMLLMAFLAWKTTKMEFRQAQNFTFNPIVEVAVLFLGIFITMIPALLVLYDWGPRSPIKQPWHFFWAAGSLSSFLDNAPTYLTYLSLALGQGVPDGVPFVQTAAGPVKEISLLAISVGAVFMGANSYIGNAPNFMVKSIAEENKVKMPSFFGYMAWSVGILIPTFILITLIFFS